MKSGKIISVLVIAIIAILMLTTVMATVQAVSAVKVKITWDANGGKIATGKTVVTTHTKGVKIGKLPKTPIKSGYVFSGWYSKKSGGTKVTTATKVEKKLTVYAHWKKKSSTGNGNLVGHWKKFSSSSYYGNYVGYRHYYFYSDGKFVYFDAVSSMEKVVGKYSISNGKIYFKEVKFYNGMSVDKINENQKKFGLNYPKYQYSSNNGPYAWNNMITEYKFGSDREGSFLQITTPRNYDPPNSYTLTSADKFYKVS